MKHVRLRGLAGATLSLVVSAGLAPTANAAEVGIGRSTPN